MTDRLSWAINKGEPATAAALSTYGYAVELYGQGMLTDNAREMLRGVPTPTRWTPDFMVTRATITDRPRWPVAIRGKYVFFVDSKYRQPHSANHSVEMRSLIAAPSFGMDVFYVCSTRHGTESQDFGVIHQRQLLADDPGIRSCCAYCGRIFTNSRDPMRELPVRCPAQQRSMDASGTPYVVFPQRLLLPLSDSVFDNLRPGVWDHLQTRTGVP